MNLEALIAALGGRKAGDGWLCRCPAHDDRTPSLSIRVTRTGLLLYHCFAGCPHGSVAKALCERGLLLAPDHHRALYEREIQRARAEQERNRHRREALARKIWKESQKADGTDVESYIRSRSIRCRVPPSIRHHPSAYESPGKTMSAMIAAVVGIGGNIIGAHRTFLDGPAKAPIERPKRMLGSCAGGAVRLSDDAAGRLIVGEGLETSLSLLDLLGGRVWATLSTAGMKSLALPEKAGELLIMADGDVPGRGAAEALASRAREAGWSVEVQHAPQGKDWNDMARETGLET